VPTIKVSGEGSDQALQIPDRNAADEGRRRRGGRDLSEPQSMGELREGSEGRVHLVIGPSFEGAREEEADHIAGVGRRSTRSARGAYRERGWQFPNELGESSQDAPPPVAQELPVTDPVDAPTTRWSRWVFRSVGW